MAGKVTQYDDVLMSLWLPCLKEKQIKWFLGYKDPKRKFWSLFFFFYLDLRDRFEIKKISQSIKKILAFSFLTKNRAGKQTQTEI